LNTSKDMRGFESKMMLIEFRNTMSSVGLSSRIKLNEARCELRPAAEQRHETQVKSRGRFVIPTDDTTANPTYRSHILAV